MEEHHPEYTITNSNGVRILATGCAPYSSTAHRQRPELNAAIRKGNSTLLQGKIHTRPSHVLDSY